MLFDCHHFIFDNLPAHFTGCTGMASAGLVRDLANQKPPRIPTHHAVGCNSDRDHWIGHADVVADDSWSKLGREIDVGFICDSNALATNMDHMGLAQPAAHSLDLGTANPDHRQPHR